MVNGSKSVWPPFPGFPYSELYGRSNETLTPGLPSGYSFETGLL